MSTISDALKKVQKQRHGNQPPIPAPPSQPRHDHGRIHAKPEPLPHRSSGGPSFLLILTGVMIAVAGVFYYLRITGKIVFSKDDSPAPAPRVEVSAGSLKSEAVPAPVAPVSGGGVTAAEVVVKQPVPVPPATPIVASKVVRTDIPVLGGIFYSEKNPVAMINGFALKEGEMVGAYQVVKILTYSVTLKCDGEEVELRLK